VSARDEATEHYGTARPADVVGILATDRRDPARRLRDNGVDPTGDLTTAAARDLHYQPATALQAMARTIVEFTGAPAYDQLLRDVFTHTPVHLIAGARSRPAWHVPEWAPAAAATYTEIPDTGHMVMLEQPEALGAVLAAHLATRTPG
jgi:pimeloyl-ACP methyl ester carboxylesterase